MSGWQRLEVSGCSALKCLAALHSALISVQSIPGATSNLMMALINDAIDIAFIEGPWFDTIATFPPFNQFKFRVLDLQTQMSSFGYPYTMQRSTPVYNGLIVSAMPSIAPAVRLLIDRSLDNRK